MDLDTVQTKNRRCLFSSVCFGSSIECVNMVDRYAAPKAWVCLRPTRKYAQMRVPFVCLQFLSIDPLARYCHQRFRYVNLSLISYFRIIVIVSTNSRCNAWHFSISLSIHRESSDFCFIRFPLVSDKTQAPYSRLWGEEIYFWKHLRQSQTYWRSI